VTVTKRSSARYRHWPFRCCSSPGAQLVEVLPAEEYEWAHLPGAVSLSLKRLDEGMEQLDRSRPVIAYCNDTL
jgi:rhodanese-related sulfurtransferase